MKPTQITELLASIRVTFVSFFSILMFVALGVGVFLGISWAGPALQNAADDYFNEGRFHDFQIQFPYGLTDADLKELAHVEGVSKVEEGHQSFQTLRKDEANLTVKVQSLGREIDRPLVVEGELPEKPNEMAFHAESAKTIGVSVGDTVTFEHDANTGEGDVASLGVGDSSVGQADVSDGMRYLVEDAFKVTAIINTADYAAKPSETYGYSNSPSGSVDVLVWVPDAAFDAPAFQNGFPVVNVACESLGDLGAFSDGYGKASDEIEERISELGKGLAVARYDQLHGNAQAQLDDAEKQLNDGKAKIADGEKQIANGEERLAQGRAELDQAVAAGEAELANAYNLLMEGELTKARAEVELASGRARVSEARMQLSWIDGLVADGETASQDMKSYKAEQDRALALGEITQKEHERNLDKYGERIINRVLPFAQQAGVKLPGIIDHTNFGAAIRLLDAALESVDDITIEIEGETMTIGEARGKLEEYEQLVATGQAELDAKSAELSAGWAQYYAGRDELEAKKAAGEQELAKGEAELEDAKRQLQDAQAQVAEKEPKLEEAKAKVAELKKFDWSVMPRAYNAGVIEVNTFSDVTGHLSISMAALFIIVGLLVSYFAVSRIVHEQVSQIGTKKALGFRQGEITKSFLLYSGIAVVAGTIVGAITGYILVEGIIGGVLADMFAFGSYPAYFGWGLFAIMAALELALILGATYLACRSILKRHAVELLRGEKPPEGKTRFYEKWGLWDKLPLFLQTVVNNCVNDKRRMLSTVVGVAGSTALIVTALTLNNDVMKSYDFHYKDVYGFNAIAYVENSADGAIDKVESTLRKEGATTARTSMRRYLMEQPNGQSGSMHVIVPLDEGAFNQLYHVVPTSGGLFNLSGKGAWVSQAYADHMDAKVGDVIVLDSGDGTKHEVPILGFYEFWLTYHEMIVGADYFQEEFGQPTAGALLVQTNGVDAPTVQKAVSGVKGFDSIVDDAGKQYKNFETFSKVSSAVVAIYLALAALMSIVVLLNLNVMFIEEKKRELIVLMINGFSVKDAKHYISYDSIVLTALGIVVGIVLGCVMGSVTVASIEPPTGVFVKAVDAWAVIIGIGGSAILAIIMGVIALRRIPRFELTDINKF